MKAILAGWLIALIVWLIPGAGQSRLLLILIITYVVAAAHFSHIIAGSVEAAFNVFVGHISLGEYFTRFMVADLDRQHDRRCLARRDPQPRTCARRAAGGATSDSLTGLAHSDEVDDLEAAGTIQRMDAAGGMPFWRGRAA